MRKIEARLPTKAKPRYAKGVFIVTRERAEFRSDVFWGIGIALFSVAFPALLAVLS